MYCNAYWDLCICLLYVLIISDYLLIYTIEKKRKKYSNMLHTNFMETNTHKIIL